MRERAAPNLPERERLVGERPLKKNINLQKTKRR